MEKSEHNKKVVTERALENPKVNETAHTKEFVPPLPFPQRLKKKKLDDQF